MVEGKLQREGEVIHVIVKRCFNFSKLLQRLMPYKNEDPSLNTRARSDETTSRVPIPVIKRKHICFKRVFFWMEGISGSAIYSIPNDLFDWQLAVNVQSFNFLHSRLK
jgi:hypothetical protein